MQNFRLVISGKTILIPIEDALMIRFKEQFLNKTTGHGPRRKLTLESLMRGAYKQGIDDGEKRSI